MSKKELEKALKKAMDWERNLTDRQRQEIPYNQAKEEKLKEILEETWKLTEL